MHKEKPIAILDTNVITNAMQGRNYECRILKDCREGDAFNYMITRCQLTDVENSKAPFMLRYSGKILGMIKECNLDLLGVKGKHNIMLRNFLKREERSV